MIVQMPENPFNLGRGTNKEDNLSKQEGFLEEGVKEQSRAEWKSKISR